MYKILQNNKVIDVVRIPRFVRFLSSGHIALTDKTSAQGIIGSDDKTVYSFKPIDREGVTVVEIEEITLEELNRLQDLLSSGQEPCTDQATFDIIKQGVISRLSNSCKSKIISGFSIRLSDGEFHNFKLTVEDQLNLMAIENQLTAGEKTFIYHATNEPCKVFSREDMLKIISYFKRYTLYHTTYFNIAKQYINSLEDIDKVTSFTYGEDISETVKDKTIKKILKTGGNF